MKIKVFLLTALIVVLSMGPVSSAMKMDFKHHMGEIINSYLVIKNDLSSDKTTHVAEEAKKILQQAEKIEHLIKATVHSGEFHKFHTTVDIHQLEAHAEKLSGQPIKSVRQHFKPISEVVIKYVELFGRPMNVKENKLYTFHCPMYEGGSDWVQASEKTANPFYGSMMLTCGTLKSTSSQESGSKSKHDESHEMHGEHGHDH